MMTMTVMITIMTMMMTMMTDDYDDNDKDDDHSDNEDYLHTDGIKCTSTTKNCQHKGVRLFWTRLNELEYNVYLVFSLGRKRTSKRQNLQFS